MTLINKEQLLDAVMKKSYSQASIQLINDQPEVKAIPIEWIHTYLVCNDDVYFKKLQPIRDMCKAWEKENETN